MLESEGIEVDLVDYMNVGLSQATVRELLKLLGVAPEEIIRKKEALFAELGLEGAGKAAIVRSLAEHPRLLQRPIVVHGQAAVIARPIERVHEIL